MKRVYICGPMRGIPQYNFPAFDAAAYCATEHGYLAVSPADIDRANGFDGNGDFEWTPDLIRSVIARDVAALLKCDAIALLPSWQNSTGARAEIMIALFCKMPILSAEDFSLYELEVSGHNWSCSGILNFTVEHREADEDANTP